MATSYKYPPLRTNAWSYGAEIEVVDWDHTRAPLLSGMAIDEAERANVNSNGVAVDGHGKLYHLGGEILTAPSVNVGGPADQMEWIKTKWPEATCNFRTGLNIHIRVPGLRDDLKKLKRLQAFIHQAMPEILPVIDPLPVPTAKEFPIKSELTGAKKDYLRCRGNHHTLLPEWRIERQMKARTPTEFFEAEAIHPPSGKVYWTTVKRACVNLRQLLQTDTVEFRHFPGTASCEEVLSATLWCKVFLEVAFDGTLGLPVAALVDTAGPSKKRPFPKLSPYDPWLDNGYHYTSRYCQPSDDIVREHIKTWLARNKDRHV